PPRGRLEWLRRPVLARPTRGDFDGFRAEVCPRWITGFLRAEPRALKLAYAPPPILSRKLNVALPHRNGGQKLARSTQKGPKLPCLVPVGAYWSPISCHEITSPNIRLGAVRGVLVGSVVPPRPALGSAGRGDEELNSCPDAVEQAME